MKHRQFESTWQATKDYFKPPRERDPEWLKHNCIVPSAQVQALRNELRESRLQQLLAEFEEAREAFMNMPTIMGKIVRDEGWSDEEMTPEYFSECNWWMAGDVKEAARRYIIARDFNEFDPKKADMLFKLQNGGSL